MLSISIASIAETQIHQDSVRVSINDMLRLSTETAEILGRERWQVLGTFYDWELFRAMNTLGMSAEQTSTIILEMESRGITKPQRMSYIRKYYAIK